MLISPRTDMTSGEDVLHDGDRRQVRQPKPRVSETFIALSASKRRDMQQGAQEGRQSVCKRLWVISCPVRSDLHRLLGTTEGLTGKNLEDVET